MDVHTHIQKTHNITAEVHLLYKEVRTKNPGMVSTAASVVLMVCTQAHPDPQVYTILFTILEKLSLSTATGQMGQKVMLDDSQPQARVPEAAAYQAALIAIALSL